MKPKFYCKKKAPATKRKSPVQSPAIDNIINEDLLREAIIIDLKIKELNTRRNEVRTQIMEQMDEHGVSASNNDIGYVSIVHRYNSTLNLSALKKDEPELVEQLDDAGYVKRTEMKFVQIYSKI